MFWERKQLKIPVSFKDAIERNVWVNENIKLSAKQFELLFNLERNGSCIATL